MQGNSSTLSGLRLRSAAEHVCWGACGQSEKSPQATTHIKQGGGSGGRLGAAALGAALGEGAMGVGDQEHAEQQQLSVWPQIAQQSISVGVPVGSLQSHHRLRHTSSRVGAVAGAWEQLSWVQHWGKGRWGWEIRNMQNNSNSVLGLRLRSRACVLGCLWAVCKVTTGYDTHQAGCEGEPVPEQHRTHTDSSGAKGATLHWQWWGTVACQCVSGEQGGSLKAYAQCQIRQQIWHSDHVCWGACGQSEKSPQDTAHFKEGGRG